MAPTQPAPGPLDGVRVLDLTRLLPGGFLGALLADLGAEVVKVEEPTRGDPMRDAGPRTGGQSAAAWVVGRNKRSLAVDLKRPEGVELLMRLVERADVLVEGFRPGVVDRLGLGYESVSARNPRIVFASLTGYGSDGPLRSAAGHDIDYVAYAGVLGLTGAPGATPCPPGVQVADLAGATTLGVGVLAALLRAQRTGHGSRVEVAMYDAALTWTSLHAAQVWATGDVPRPGGTLLNGLLPCYGVYVCSDGRSLAVGALEPQFWSAFCTHVDRPDLLPRGLDPHARTEVADLLRTRTRDEWVEHFEGVDACVAPVLDLGEALAHPLATGRGMVVQARVDATSDETAPTFGGAVRVDGRAGGPVTPPPALGADSVALAQEAGLTPQEIEVLLSTGVLRHTDGTVRE